MALTLSNEIKAAIAHRDAARDAHQRILTPDPRLQPALERIAELKAVLEQPEIGLTPAVAIGTELAGLRGVVASFPAPDEATITRSREAVQGATSALSAVASEQFATSTEPDMAKCADLIEQIYDVLDRMADARLELQAATGGPVYAVALEAARRQTIELGETFGVRPRPLGPRETKSEQLAIASVRAAKMDMRARDRAAEPKRDAAAVDRDLQRSLGQLNNARSEAYEVLRSREEQARGERSGGNNDSLRRAQSAVRDIERQIQQLKEVREELRPEVEQQERERKERDKSAQRARVDAGLAKE